MRRGYMLLCFVALAALLTACGSAGPGASGGTSGAAQPTATPDIIALNGNDTSSQATSACGGVFSSGGPQPIYKLSDAIYVQAVYGLSYPSHRLPDTVPVAPWALPGQLGSDQLTQALGGDADVNPIINHGSGILLTVCNAGAQPLKLAGAKVAIADFKPGSGAINTWNECDGVFVRPDGVTGGGCGGALVTDETMGASFAPSAAKDAVTQAAQVSAGGPNGYGPLPVTLKPGASIMLLIGVTLPRALGMYALAVSAQTSASGGAAVTLPYAPLPPQLFARVAHKFTGQACAKAAMQAQIPTNVTNPATYYICPEQ